MNIENFFPFLIFLGLFAVFQLILPSTLIPFLKFLLNGPLVRLSTNYFKDFAKEKFDEAARQNNPDKAWEEIALAKIREMGHSRTSYEKRKQNLIYINNIVPTKRMAAGLIDILPEQHNLNFQQELACFICSVLEKISNEGTENNIKVGIVKSTLSAPLKAWSDLFSAWLSSGLLLFIIWNKLDSYSPTILTLLCILFLGFTCYPILKVNIKPSSIFAYISFSVFSVLTALALYANINHSGTNPMTIDFSDLGYSESELTVIYPKWVRYDNSNTCEKLIPISILTERGALPTPIRFSYDDNLFSARNSDCKAFAPIVAPDNLNSETFEFYLIPLDMNTLRERSISIIPVLLFPDKEVPLGKNEMIINIELTFWRIVNQTYIFIAGGTASLSIILVQVISSLRRKED